MPLNNTGRKDLEVKYLHAPAPQLAYENATQLGGMISQSMPMAAMFLKNKFIAWFAFIQTYYSFITSDGSMFEVPDISGINGGSSAATSPQPAGVKMLISLFGVLFCYSGLVLPQEPPKWANTPDKKAAAAAASKVLESAKAAVSSTTTSA